MGTINVRDMENLEVSYDRGGDVLYLSIGEPQPALTRGEENGLLVRTDPATQKVTGLTVLDYEGKFRRLPDLSWLEEKALPVQIVAFLKDRPHLA